MKFLLFTLDYLHVIYLTVSNDEMDMFCRWLRHTLSITEFVRTLLSVSCFNGNYNLCKLSIFLIQYYVGEAYIQYVFMNICTLVLHRSPIVCHLMREVLQVVRCILLSTHYYVRFWIVKIIFKAWFLEVKWKCMSCRSIIIFVWMYS